MTLTQKQFEFLLSFWFFVSLLLGICAIFVHEKTVVHWLVPSLIALAGMIIMTLLIWKKLANREVHPGMRLFFGAIYGGILFYSSSLFLNYSFARNTVFQKTFAVEKSGTEKGNRWSHSYAIVRFDDVFYKMKFPIIEKEVIMGLDSINLTYSEGLFGFPIVKSYGYEMNLPYPVRNRP